MRHGYDQRRRAKAAPGGIISNGKLIVAIDNTNARISVTSDGTILIYSAINAWTANTWSHLVVTRTAAGVVNIYINGVLSGTVNQASGTPASGATNVFIGNASDASKTFDGDLSGIRVYNGIPAEPEAFALARYEYNLPLYNSAIFLDRVLRMWATRSPAGQADISLDALLAMWADRALAGSADIALTPYLFPGIDGDTGMIARY